MFMERKIYVAPTLKEVEVELSACIAGSVVSVNAGTTQVKEVKEENVTIVSGW